MALPKLPDELQVKILIDVLNPNAQALVNIACISKRWNGIITNPCFIATCENTGIRMKPIIVFHSIKFESQGLDLLKAGLSSMNSTTRYHISKVSESVLFKYIGLEEIMIDRTGKGFFWTAGQCWLGVFVNPNVITVYNKNIAKNPYLEDEQRIIEYEQSAMPLKQYITQVKKAKKLAKDKGITSKSQQVIKFDRLTAEPGVFGNIDESIYDDYDNVILLKSPVEAARLIQNTESLKFPKYVSVQAQSEDFFLDDM